eukprot:2319379-Rhodomonas_salina.2
MREKCPPPPKAAATPNSCMVLFRLFTPYSALKRGIFRITCFGFIEPTCSSHVPPAKSSAVPNRPRKVSTAVPFRPVPSTGDCIEYRRSYPRSWPPCPCGTTTRYYSNTLWT